MLFRAQLGFDLSPKWFFFPFLKSHLPTHESRELLVTTRYIEILQSRLVHPRPCFCLETLQQVVVQGALIEVRLAYYCI